MITPVSHLQATNSDAVFASVHTALESILDEVDNTTSDILSLQEVSEQLAKTPGLTITDEVAQMLSDDGVTETVANESFGSVAATVAAKAKDMFARLIELVKRGVRYLLDMVSDNAFTMKTVVAQLKKKAEGLKSGKYQFKDEFTHANLNTLMVSAVRDDDLMGHFKESVALLRTNIEKGVRESGIRMEDAIRRGTGDKEARAMIGSSFIKEMNKVYDAIFVHDRLPLYGLGSAKNTMYSSMIFGGYVLVKKQEPYEADAAPTPVRFTAKRGVSAMSDIKFKKLNIADIESMHKAIETTVLPCVDRYNSIVKNAADGILKFIAAQEKENNGSRNNSMRDLVALFTETMMTTSSCVTRAYRGLALAANEVATKSIEKAK